MMKRVLSCLLIAAVLLTLCGCGSIFEKEYVSISDYTPTAQEPQSPAERVTVRNFTGLRSAIRSIVYAGSEESTIVFDQSYDGDSREDLATVCAQMRTQDALFAYCVQDLSYEYSTIVSRAEAVLHVRYASSAVGVDQIRRLSYATGLENILREAMEKNLSQVVILINVSSYSTLQMKQLVSDTYHASPLCAVCEPVTDVHMYSGSGRQRLYEIGLSYGMAEDEIIRRKAQLVNLDVRSNIGAEGVDDLHAVFAACRYLCENCELSDEGGCSTVYDALIAGRANAEGLALSFVEMCHQLGVACQIVYGQLAWQDHCWNIISLDGQNYHVDIRACMEEGPERGFLLGDSEMWNDYLYRWNTAAYPSCSGELHAADLGLIFPESTELSEPEQTVEETP